jgi:hypothetical protein
MGLLAWVALGLSIGWVGLWVVLGRQVQKQSMLEKKVKDLESTD